MADDARDVLARDGLERYVDLFHADHIGYDDLASRVAQWWDLERIDALYGDFIVRYQPLLTRWVGRAPSPELGAEAFADYVRALTAGGSSRTWIRVCRSVCFPRRGRVRPRRACSPT